MKSYDKWLLKRLYNPRNFSPEERKEIMITSQWYVTFALTPEQVNLIAEMAIAYTENPHLTESEYEEAHDLLALFSSSMNEVTEA